MIFNFKDGFDSTNEPAIRLLAIQVFAVFCVIYWGIKKYFGYQIWKKVLRPVYMAINNFIESKWHIIKW